MTAERWLAETDAWAMLQLAGQGLLCAHCSGSIRFHNDPRQLAFCPTCNSLDNPPRLSPRKLRLLACATCRLIWGELTGEPARQAVRVAERFADGFATPAELERARRASTAPAASAAGDAFAWRAASNALALALERLKSLHAAELNADLHVHLAAVNASVEASFGHLGSSAVKGMRRLREQRFRDDYSQRLNKAQCDDRARMCAVLHDVLGNPFAPVPIKPEWLEADGGRVRQVAGGIYADGDFEAMPVLADALQDAGCQDARLLDHCLQDSHYRGCWLLDAILGKR